MTGPGRAQGRPGSGPRRSGPGRPPGRPAGSARRREEHAVDDVDRGVGGLDVAADDLGRAVDGEVLAASGHGQSAPWRVLCVRPASPGSAGPGRRDRSGRSSTDPSGRPGPRRGWPCPSPRRVSAGAKTVMSSAVFRVSPRPAAVTAVTRVDEGGIVGGRRRDRILGHASRSCRHQRSERSRRPEPNGASHHCARGRRWRRRGGWGCDRAITSGDD